MSFSLLLNWKVLILNAATDEDPGSALDDQLPRGSFSSFLSVTLLNWFQGDTLLKHLWYIYSWTAYFSRKKPDDNKQQQQESVQVLQSSNSFQGQSNPEADDWITGVEEWRCHFCFACQTRSEILWY